MEKVNVPLCLCVAVLLAYGWMPVCWAIGKLAGWC